jgi:hypothetical protein
MTQIKGTNVLAPVVPFDTTDTHASHEAKYGKGGYRSVADATERDAIPSPRREAGMLALTLSDGKVWKLASDLTTWSEFSAGTSSASSVAWTDITGRPATFTPSAHTHQVADVSGLQTALDLKQAAGSYAAASHSQAWSTITSTPTTLSGYGITDAVGSSDSRLTDSRTPTSHVHGNISNAGAIGSTSGQIVVTTTSGVLTTAATIASTAVSGLPTAGTGSTNYCAGNDSRLSDSRSPTSHASTHASGGADAISIAASQVSGLATVATSGSYSDLSNKPTIPAATTSASALTSGTLSQARLDFTPIHPFVLMGG